MPNCRLLHLSFSDQPLPNVGENPHRHSNHDRERTQQSGHDPLHHNGYHHNVELGARLLLSNESLKYCPKEPNFTYIIDWHMQQHTCQKPVLVNGKVVGGEYNEGRQSQLFSNFWGGMSQTGPTNGHVGSNQVPEVHVSKWKSSKYLFLFLRNQYQS